MPQELQCEQRGQEFGQGGGCHEQPATNWTLRCRDDCPYAQGGDQRIVGLRHQGEVGERVEQVRKHERLREWPPSEPLAELVQSGERQRIEAHRRQQRRDQRRRRREDSRERDVRVVGERAVGVRAVDSKPAGALPGHRPVKVQSVQNAPGAE